MYKITRHSKNYKKHTTSKFCKAKKIINRRKECWMNLFTKYSQPILNKTIINIKTMAEESDTDGLQLNMKNKTKSASKEREHIVLNPKYLISHSFKPKSPNWFDLCEKIESENEMYVNIRSENKKNKNDSEFQQDNNSKQILWSIGSSGISCIDLKSNKVMDTTKLWKDTTSENSAKLLDYNNSTVKNIAHQAHKQLIFQTQEFDFDSDYNSE